MGSVPLIASQWTPESPYEGYQKMAELQQRLRQAQQQHEQNAQQLQMGALDLQKTRMGLEQTQAMNTAFQAALRPPAASAAQGPPMNGQAPGAPPSPQPAQAQAPTFDPSRIYQSLAASGQGSAIPALQKHFADLDKVAGDVQKTKDEHIAAAEEYFAALVKGVQSQGYAPEAMGVALAHAAASGYPQEAMQVQTELAQNPAQLRPFIDAMISRSPKQAEAAKNFAEASTSAQRLQMEMPGIEARGVVAQQEAGMTPEQRAMQSNLPYAAAGGSPRARQAMALETQQKIQASAAEGAAKAKLQQQGQGGALANVAPHLVAPATADATKVGSEYADAASAATDMQSFVNSARAGNKIAYAYSPVEGVLTLNTGRGVKRVNMSEIESYGGAGSAWDRVTAFFGKQASGASLPADVLNDMESLHVAIAKNAETHYGNKLKVINQNYGSNFQPVQMQGEAATAGAPSGPPPGATHNAMGSDKKWHYTNAQGQDLGVAQ